MDTSVIVDQLLRLALAVGAGMAVGMEREWREKAAGFRTLTLVSAGAAIIVMLAQYIPGQEQARLGAGIITGIGFLGAGTILRERHTVLGLTTAACVWISAALGMAAGYGAYALTVVGTLVALVVLLLFPALEISELSNESREYEVTTSTECDYHCVADVLRSQHLGAHRVSVTREGDAVTSVWRGVGKPARHAEATRLLMADETIRRVSVT